MLNRHLAIAVSFLALTACTNPDGSWTSGSWSSYNLWSFIIQTIVAVATVIVSCVALFGEPIRRKLYSPSIAPAIQKSEPFVRYVESSSNEQNASSESDRSIDLRFKIKNSGRSEGRNIRVRVQSLWALRDGAGSYYPIVNIAPHPVHSQFHSQGSDRTVRRGQEEYVLFAKLGVSEAMTGSTGNPGPRHASSTITVLLPSWNDADGFEWRTLREKRVIICFHILCDEVPNGHVFCASIDWTGSTISPVLPEQDFDVKIISNKQFTELTKTEVK